jgi:hypothetical protein
MHDRDHVHPHIHAKHVIHPPKINIPKFKEIFLLVILQKEIGVIAKKTICLRSTEKMIQSKSIGKKE